MELHYNNIGQFLAEKVALIPENIALEMVEGDKVERLTFSKLYDKSTQLASHLKDKLPPNSRVMILHANSLDFAVSFFACALSHMIAVPCYPPLNDKLKKKLISMVQDCQPQLFLASDSVINKLKAGLFFKPLLKLAYGLKIPFVTETDIEFINCLSPKFLHKHLNLERPQCHETFVNNVDIDSIALLHYDTDTDIGCDNKGVMITHRNIIHNSEMTKSIFNHTSESKAVSLLSAYHPMGIIGSFIQSVYAGFTLRIMSPFDFEQSPISWLKHISDMQASTSGGSLLSYARCLTIQENNLDLDLSCWKKAFCVSQHVKQPVLEEFIEKFSKYGFKANAFMPCYGLAESTALVTGKKVPDSSLFIDSNDLYTKKRITIVEYDNKYALQLSGCGAFDKSIQELIVVDEENYLPLLEGRIGLIMLRSDSVAKGYWNDIQTSQETFNVKINGENYLNTGELGFTHNNTLYVIGRFKDVMTIEGGNYYPGLIECTLEATFSDDKLSQMAVLQINETYIDSLSICIEVSHNDEVYLADIGKKIYLFVLKNLAISVSAIYFVSKSFIPKTNSGNIAREQLIEKLDTFKTNYIYRPSMASNSHVLQTVLDYSDESINSIIDTVLEKVSKNFKLKSDDNINAIFIDSITQMELLSRLESTFKVPSIPHDILTSSLTINEFKSYILNHVRQAQNQSEIQHLADIEYFPILPMPNLFLQYFGNIEFNIAFVCDIKKTVSFNIFKEALKQLIDIQPALKCQYQLEKQCTLLRSNTEILEKALCFYETNFNDKKLKCFINEKISECSQTQNIYEAPLFKVIFIDNNGSQYVAAIFNHMIIDPFSLEIFYQQLDTLLYNNQDETSANYLKKRVHDDCLKAIDFLNNSPCQAINLEYFKQNAAQKKVVDPNNTIENEQAYRYCLPKAAYVRLKKFANHNQLTLDSILMAITLKSLNEQMSCDRYIQVINHGRKFSPQSPAIHHLIGWFTIGWPLAIGDLNLDLLHVSQEINALYQEQGCNAWMYNDALSKGSMDNLIDLHSSEIEYSNLTTLTLETERYFELSKLYASDYLAHGNTFNPSMHRYRNIFIRPYLEGENLVILFHIKKGSLDINQLTNSLSQYFGEVDIVV